MCSIKATAVHTDMPTYNSTQLVLHRSTVKCQTWRPIPVKMCQNKTRKIYIYIKQNKITIAKYKNNIVVMRQSVRFDLRDLRDFILFDFVHFSIYFYTVILTHVKIQRQRTQTICQLLSRYGLRMLIYDMSNLSAQAAEIHTDTFIYAIDRMCKTKAIALKKLAEKEIVDVK